MRKWLIVALTLALSVAFYDPASAISLGLDVPSGFFFTSTLQVGSTGADVTNLQKVLKGDGVYPEGLVTGYFGSLTKKAVISFQTKYGIDPIGIVGPKTRLKLNQILIAVRAASAAPPPAPVTQTTSSILDAGGGQAPEPTAQDVAKIVQNIDQLPATTTSLKQLKLFEQQLNSMLSQSLTLPVGSTSTPTTP